MFMQRLTVNDLAHASSTQSEINVMFANIIVPDSSLSEIIRSAHQD